MSKSPFPGMDPYLEKNWRDVHSSLCNYSRDDIQSQIGGSLVARVDERLVVEVVPGYMRPVSPDVAVLERPGDWDALMASGGGTAVAEPVVVEVEHDDHFEGFVEIKDIDSNQVITVIEFISKSNKSSEHGRGQYQLKQWELREAGVSLVEVNLLRGGLPVMQVLPEHIPVHARTPYQAIVHRSWDGRRHEVYPMPIHKPLPKIGIPLRKSEKDAVLDLQSLIDRAYRNGAYHLTIDYSKPAEPPLEGDDAAWAQNLLKQTIQH